MNRKFLTLIYLMLASSLYAFSASDYKEKCESEPNHSLQHQQICKKLARKLNQHKPSFLSKKTKTDNTSVTKHKKIQTTPNTNQHPKAPNTPVYTNKPSNYHTPNNTTLSGLTFKPYTPGAYQQTTTSELNDES